VSSLVALITSISAVRWNRHGIAARAALALSLLEVLFLAGLIAIMIAVAVSDH
jgi:Ca2+/Na+ antiporter